MKQWDPDLVIASAQLSTVTHGRTIGRNVPELSLVWYGGNENLYGL